MLELEEFTRNPLAVRKVTITPANIDEVARWCGGKVRNDGASNAPSKQYVKVEVKRTTNERQKRAYVGDHVLRLVAKGVTSFKVYTRKAFDEAFSPTGAPLLLESADAPDEGIILVAASELTEAQLISVAGTKAPRPGPRKGVKKQVSSPPVKVTPPTADPILAEQAAGTGAMTYVEQAVAADVE